MQNPLRKTSTPSESPITQPQDNGMDQVSLKALPAAVPFIVCTPNAEAQGVGRLLSIRMEAVRADAYPRDQIIYFVPEDVASSGDSASSSSNSQLPSTSALIPVSEAEGHPNLNPETCRSRIVQALVIERAVNQPTTTPDAKNRTADNYAQQPDVCVVHVYSLHPSIEEFLCEFFDPILQEDAMLLSFALSTMSSNGHSSEHTHSSSVAASTRQMMKQVVGPLEQENLFLRSLIGLGPRESISKAPRKVAALRRSMDEPVLKGERTGTVIPSAVASRTTQKDETTLLASPSSNAPSGVTPRHQQQQQRVVLVDKAVQTLAHPNSIDPRTDPFAIHSPLQWEMETEAAVNARTRYQPFKEHSSARDAARKLDAVTQIQLVTRLHDRSMDDRARRLLEYEERLMRDLGVCEHRVLTQDEQSDLGARLHDQQRVQSEKILEKLKSQYLAPLEHRTMSKEEIQVSNARIYKEPMDRKRVNLDKLYKKYIFDVEDSVPKKKLTIEQQKQMADRLCQGK